MKLDKDQLLEDLTAIVTEALKPALEGAQADVDAFAAEIGKDFYLAVKLGDSSLQDTLLNQTKMLAELSRVRVVKAGMEAWRKVAEYALKVAKAVLV